VGPVGRASNPSGGTGVGPESGTEEYGGPGGNRQPQIGGMESEAPYDHRRIISYDDGGRRVVGADRP